MVEISLKDSGIGIPQENLHKVFEPFFSTKNMGTGLGLSISYGIIEEHKGTIRVECGEEKGTRFVIKLPKLSQEALSLQMMVG